MIVSMRILEISSAKGFGGGEKHLIDLSQGLIDRGHDVYFAFREKSELLNRFDDMPKEQTIKIPLRNAVDVGSAYRIAQFIRANSIDIVHAHLARDYPIASLAQRLNSSVNFFLTRHVMFPLKPIQKYLLGNARNAIAVSAGVERRLGDIFPKEKIVCIPNGIAFEEYTNENIKTRAVNFRKDHEIAQDVALISIVGELNSLKGQEEFVIAAGEIEKEFDDTHFLILGKEKSIDRGYRRNLRRLVKVLGLEKKFTFLDWVDDLSPAFSATDILVSASHTESFGLAILEAMASKTAIVATDTVGARELIKDQSVGDIVPIRDSYAIANAVLQFLRDDSRRKLVSKNARERAQKEFGLTKMIDQTEKLFIESLLI